MATDWTAEQVGLYEDFREEGFPMTVRVPGSPGEYVAEIAGYVGGTDAVDYSTYGIKANYDISQIDGDNIKQNDIKLLFPAYGLPAVTTDNQILIGGVIQNVVNIKVVDPGNVTLLYEAQVRYA